MLAESKIAVCQILVNDCFQFIPLPHVYGVANSFCFAWAFVFECEFFIFFVAEEKREA